MCSSKHPMVIKLFLFINQYNFVQPVLKDMLEFSKNMSIICFTKLIALIMTSATYESKERGVEDWWYCPLSSSFKPIGNQIYILTRLLTGFWCRCSINSKILKSTRRIKVCQWNGSIWCHNIQNRVQEKLIFLPLNSLNSRKLPFEKNYCKQERTILLTMLLRCFGEKLFIIRNNLYGSNYKLNAFELITIISFNYISELLEMRDPFYDILWNWTCQRKVLFNTDMWLVSTNKHIFSISSIS